MRDEDLALQAGGRGVGGGGVAGVARRRQEDRGRAERLGARDRRRQAARLERVGRVERFVLDEQALEAERRAEPLRVNQRREAFAERDRLVARAAAASARDTATCWARGRRAMSRFHARAACRS